MTIDRIENPGAVLAGYQCQQCEIDIAAKLREDAQKPLTQQRAQSLKNWENIIYGDENRLPYDVLHATETGLKEAETAVTEHDKLHPTHNIILWQFDKDHLLSTPQVKKLSGEGVTHAYAYGEENIENEPLHSHQFGVEEFPQAMQFLFDGEIGERTAAMSILDFQYTMKTGRDDTGYYLSFEFQDDKQAPIVLQGMDYTQIDHRTYRVYVKENSEET